MIQYKYTIILVLVLSGLTNGFGQANMINLKLSLTHTSYKYRIGQNGRVFLNGTGASIMPAYSIHKNIKTGIFYSRGTGFGDYWNHDPRTGNNSYFSSSKTKFLNTGFFGEYVLPLYGNIIEVSVLMLIGKSEYVMAIQDRSSSYLIDSYPEPEYPILANLASRSYFGGIGVGITYFPFDPVGINVEASTVPLKGKPHFYRTFEIDLNAVEKRKFYTLSVGILVKAPVKVSGKEKKR